MLLYFSRVFSRRGANVAKSVQRVLGNNGKVVKVDLRPAQGGAFVKIASERPAEVETLASRGFRSYFYFWPTTARGFEVRGKPFVTDLPFRRSRVVETIPSMEEEQLYALLRPYGRLRSVSNGRAVFQHWVDAQAAVYCENGVGDPKTVLRLVPTVPPLVKSKEWVKSHPRIVLPLLSLLLLYGMYVVFEPIREFFVFRSLKKVKSSKPVLGDDADGAKLLSWLKNGDQVFVAVVGPDGSGKSEICMETVGKLGAPAMVIECDRLKCDGQEMLYQLAASIGYRPTLLWANRLLKLLELAVRGATGQNSEISESQEQQMDRMLHTATSVLQSVSLDSSLLRRAPLTDAEKEYLAANPQVRPVVILNQFEQSKPCERLAQWGAELLRNNIARVVCVSKDTGFEKPLQQALPNKVVQTVRVEDAPPAKALKYVCDALLNEHPNSETAKRAAYMLEKGGASAIAPLGGRFSDLQAFAKRLMLGEDPKTALETVINQAKVEIMQLYLTEQREWSLEQAWRVLLLLVARKKGEWLLVPSVVITKPEFSTFEGDKQQSQIDSVLNAMDAAGMLTVNSVGGHVRSIKPARPVYYEAFQALATDPLVSLYMDMRTAKSAVLRETAKIMKFEKELKDLSEINTLSELGRTKSDSVKKRTRYVCEQLDAAQTRLEAAAEELERTNKSLARLE